MKYLKILFKAKWELSYPKKCDVLIYDGNNNPFSNFLNQRSKILYVRGEILNVPILLNCLFKNKLNFDEYISAYLKYVKPKIILTFIDNSQYFYSIYKKIKCKTIFVQNGLRSKVSDIFSNNKLIKNKNKNKFKVDFMFVFNSKIGKMYNSFIKGKFIPIGSFKNNLVRINKKNKLNRILIISTFRNYDKNYKFHKKMLWGKFVEKDKDFIMWMIELSKKYNISIDVLGRYSIAESDEELKFFKNIFKDINFKFIDNYKNRNPYKLVDNYEYVFTIDSTLGIECLARGGRVGFFCNRPNIFPFITRKFGWMENFKYSGPFWTYKNSKKELERIFKVVVSSKPYIWNKILKKYKSKVMSFDNQNSIFKKIIKENL